MGSSKTTHLTKFLITELCEKVGKEWEYGMCICPDIDKDFIIDGKDKETCMIIKSNLTVEDYTDG